MNDIQFDPKEVDEVLGTPGSTEAPLSIHIDSYYRGFHTGITIRMNNNESIPAGKIALLINQLIAGDFKPSWNPDTNAAFETPKPVASQPVTPQIVSDPCPKCGAPLVEAVKKDGTPYKKCSTNKWNSVTKKATGCDYVDWGK